MKCECQDISKELRKYISNLDDYKVNALLRNYTDKSVKYLKLLFRDECKKVGSVEYEGVEFVNLFELYCLKCYFLADYWIFKEHTPQFKSVFMDIIENEMTKEEIEIMWYGHYVGNWFSFAPRLKEKFQTMPSSDKMMDDLVESIIMHPVLDEDEEQATRVIAERYRLVTLPIYVQEKCVMAGLKLPSISLASEMVNAFATLFNNDYGNILEPTGQTCNLSMVEGAILPYIKFMGYSLCGRQEDDYPAIESDDETSFYEQNENVFIKLLDTSFYNYYLYRYSSLSGYQRNNYIDAVKLLFFETLQDLAPQLDDVNLNDERKLIVTVFAEKADCYTHMFALYLQGIQGKEMRIRDEFATTFPLISHLL